MRTSATTKDLFGAIVAAQSCVAGVKTSAENPAFKRQGKALRYADLADHWAAIRPALKGYGLAIVQELLSAEHGVNVLTIIIHDSGEWLEVGPLFVPASKQDAHGYGSACAYARRYALSAAFGTYADDDDGNAAVAAVAAVAAPVEVPAPAGYSQWVVGMEDFAEAGMVVFRAEYAASPGQFRAYLEKQQPNRLASMVHMANEIAKMENN
jgi:hypothetical protein